MEQHVRPASKKAPVSSASSRPCPCAVPSQTDQAHLWNLQNGQVNCVRFPRPGHKKHCGVCLGPLGFHTWGGGRSPVVGMLKRPVKSAGLPAAPPESPHGSRGLTSFLPPQDRPQARATQETASESPRLPRATVSGGRLLNPSRERI